jgi:hypothetical protein
LPQVAWGGIIGWGFWLDILDLASVLRKLAAWARWLDWPPTPLRISIFAAARIEIELLDGSHVIAAMTKTPRARDGTPIHKSFKPQQRQSHRGA